MNNTRGHIAGIALAVPMFLMAGGAAAGPWPYPDEISVTDAYNRMYGTTYDSTREGLTQLVGDFGQVMQPVWTTNDFRYLEMLAFDTSSTTPFGLVVGGSFFQIFDPGPWTAPTRGWLPDSNPLSIDLEQFLQSNGQEATASFSFSVGSTALTAQNTYFLATPEADQQIFAYNGGGLLAGDQDANEPLFCVSSVEACTQAQGVSEPATVALWLAALLGFGARRLTSASIG